MKNPLLKSTATVSSMTLCSRIVGFIRDMVVAQLFGAIAGMDAFLVAFKIPNFFRRLFAEGAFSQAIVPVLAEYRQHNEPEQVKTFIANMTGMLGIFLLVITVIAELAAPLVISVFAPGFPIEGERYTLATHLLHITFPYLFFISLTAFLGAILNTYNRFAAPAFTPLLLNMGMITAAFLLAPALNQPIMALGWGIFIAGIAQLIFILIFGCRLKLIAFPRFNWRDPGVKKVFTLMLPALLGVSVLQISLIIDTLFSSFLPVGSVSWLYYSDRISTLPLGIFGVAIATVILPFLSNHTARHFYQDFSWAIDWGLRLVFLLALPAGLGLFILAGPILSTLLQYGQFNTFDVMMTTQSLEAYALGIPGFMLIKVLVTGFYARQNMRLPVMCSVIALVANVVLNAILIWPLAHRGLALATSLSCALNALLLFVALQRQGHFCLQPGWFNFIAKLAIANGMMALYLMLAVDDLAEWLVWDWQQRAGQLALLITIAAIIYFFTLRLLGFRWNNLKTLEKAL